MLILLGLVSLPSWAVGQEGAVADRPDSLAVEFVEQLARRDFGAATQRFDSTMGVVMPPARLEETWDAVLAQSGEFQEWSTTRQLSQQGYDIVLVATGPATRSPRRLHKTRGQSTLSIR